jgi:hypothetical protein
VQLSRRDGTRGSELCDNCGNPGQIPYLQVDPRTLKSSAPLRPSPAAEKPLVCAGTTGAESTARWRGRRAHATHASWSTSIMRRSGQKGCDGTVLIGCSVDSTLTEYAQLTSGQDPNTKKCRECSPSEARGGLWVAYM